MLHIVSFMTHFQKANKYTTNSLFLNFVKLNFFGIGQSEYFAKIFSTLFSFERLLLFFLDVQFVLAN